MAGCYGNSAEDRYYEAMLDRYLDEQVSSSDVYGDEANAIINERFGDPNSEFGEWLIDNFCLDENSLTEETINNVMSLLMEDETARKTYHDKVYDDLCCELAQEAADRLESAREEAAERAMEYERDNDY